MEVRLQRAQQAQTRHQPLDLLLLRIGDDTTDDVLVYEHSLLPVGEISPVGP